MTDCTCHAGKICGICEVEVMGNLNKYAMSTNIEYPESHVKMEGNKIGKMVGKFIPEGQQSTPEQIERDILDELSVLRQKVADLETAKKFHMTCIENVIERVAELERQAEVRDKVLERVLNIKEGRG